MYGLADRSQAPSTRFEKLYDINLSNPSFSILSTFRMAPIAMAKLPTTTGDYHILPLQISAPAAYSTPSTHYLYIRTHEPKIPDARSPRSLFVVNVPIDATEDHFRSLFAEHLGGSRVENVEFETTRPTKSAMSKQTSAQSGRKRKRRSDEDATATQLPTVWDREVHRSGSAAIVVFVDEPSMQVALKSVKKIAKARTSLVWGQGLEGRLPALGSQSMLLEAAHKISTY